MNLKMGKTAGTVDRKTLIHCSAGFRMIREIADLGRTCKVRVRVIAGIKGLMIPAIGYSRLGMSTR